MAPSTFMAALSLMAAPLSFRAHRLALASREAREAADGPSTLYPVRCKACASDVSRRTPVAARVAGRPRTAQKGIGSSAWPRFWRRYRAATEIGLGPRSGFRYGRRTRKNAAERNFGVAHAAQERL